MHEIEKPRPHESPQAQVETRSADLSRQLWSREAMLHTSGARTSSTDLLSGPLHFNDIYAQTSGRSQVNRPLGQPTCGNDEEESAFPREGRNPYQHRFGVQTRRIAEHVEQQNREPMRFAIEMFDGAANNTHVMDLSSRAMVGLRNELNVTAQELGVIASGLVRATGGDIHRAQSILEFAGRHGRLLGVAGIWTGIAHAAYRAYNGDVAGGGRELINVGLTVAAGALGASVGGPVGGALAALLTDRALNMPPMPRHDWDRRLRAPSQWAHRIEGFDEEAP